MSNARVISRIELALDRYVRGKLPASEVERAVNLSIRALDRIGSAEEHEASRLAARLMDADLAHPPAAFEWQLLSFEGEESVADVLRDFRAFLAQLPR